MVEKEHCTLNKDRSIRKKREKDNIEQLVSKKNKTFEQTGVLVTYTRLMSDFLKHTQNKKHFETFIQNYFSSGNVDKNIEWHDKKKKLTIIAEDKSNHKYAYKISAIDMLNMTPILIACHDIEDNNLRIKQFLPNNLWLKNDIYELVTTLNFFLRANISYSKKIPSSQQEKIEIDVDEPLNFFENVKEFSDVIISYSNNFTIIPQFVTYHTEQRDNSNVFWMSWPQTKIQNSNFSLEVSISPITFKTNPTKKDYFSWVFAESEFLKLHGYPSETLTYYQVKVSECIANSSERILKNQYKQIIDTWFSVDSQFGELRNIEKGNILTGAEIMEVFNFLNYLFRVQNIYLCDASRITNEPERTAGQIVFRVIMSIAYGKTWYEKFGYAAFSFENLLPGWPDEHNRISQDAEQYFAAREKLRVMPLTELAHFFLMEETKYPARKNQDGKVRSEILTYLQEKYVKNQDITLGDFSQMLYTQSKSNKDDQTLANDLGQMYDLLIIPDYFFELMSKKREIADQQFNYLLSKIVLTQFFKKTYHNEVTNKEITKQNLLNNTAN